MTDRMVIRGGHVLTMDPGVGDLTTGDVLVEGDRIVAISSRIDTTDARQIDARGCVVMPGFVDTHRHTWQTQMRGLCAGWTLSDYFSGIRMAVSPAYSADDVYVGNYTGALEALNAGITTVLDFSHCNNTPEHADAAIKGLEDAGIRALYCYGFFAPGGDNAAFPTHGHRLADFTRILAAHSASSPLLIVGAALTEVGVIPWSQTVAEIEAARSAAAPIVTHTGCVWGSVVTGIRELGAHGLLGPDQIHVHCNTLDDDDWHLLSRAGAKVSISPETELNMGMGRLAIDKCLEHGIHPSLSCDIVSLNSGDLFTQMRLALAYQRFVENDRINRSGAMPTALTCGARDALRWATLYGAEACGLDAEIGSLCPGKRADIIVLGRGGFALRPLHDPPGSIVFQASAHDVRDVLVAGRLVKTGGALVDVDLDAVLGRAERSAEQILSRVRRVAPVLPPKPRADVDFEALARWNLAEAAQPART